MSNNLLLPNENDLDKAVSIGEATSNTFRQVPFSQVVHTIKSGEGILDAIQKIRDCKDPEKRRELKQQLLPMFSMGVFKDNTRLKKNLQSIQHIIIDLDHLNEKLPAAIVQAKQDERVYCCFISPSGDGLKLICRLDKEITDAAVYEKVYLHYADTFSKEYGHEADTSCKDASRGCFVSFDPDIHINVNVVSLAVDLVEPVSVVKKGKKQKDGEDPILPILNGVEKNRNESLVKLCGYLLGHNHSEEHILAIARGWNLQNKEPLDEKELVETLNKQWRLYGDPACLEKPFSVIRREKKKYGYDDAELAQVYFKWLKHNRRAEYFTDESDMHYVYINGRLIPMDDSNQNFAAMLLQTANITTADRFGKVTVQVLNASAQLEGKRIRRSTWVETRQEDFKLFLNLQNDQHQIIKITPSECVVIPNGENDEGIFMHETLENKLQPIQFTVMDNEELSNALLRGDSLIARHIPCSDDERYFAYGWRLSYPLYDFTTMHITLRAQGGSSTGKSTACDVLSVSLYGQSFQSMSTTASLYRDASVNPLIIEDNLENKRFYEDEGHGEFYLLAATGGTKQKSARGSDSGLAVERVRSLVLCNGIESIAKPEQTNRMMIIECDKNTYNSGYTSAVLLDIKRFRNELLSANFILAQRVLKRIQEGDWHEVQKRLATEYPDHPKSRMFEHIALIIMFLEEHQKAAGVPTGVWELVANWMRKQKQVAREEIVDSDPILQALELIRISAEKQTEWERTHVGSDAYKDRPRVIKLEVDSLVAEVNRLGEFSISGTAGELLSSFSKAYNVHLNKPFPIQTGRILSQRIGDVMLELELKGYVITIGEDKHNDQKIYTFAWKRPE